MGKGWSSSESSRRLPSLTGAVPYGDDRAIQVPIPRIEITSETLEYIQACVDLHPVEIAGLGRIEEVADGVLRIVQAVLVEQQGSMADVDITEGAAKFFVELEEAHARQCGPTCVIHQPVAPWRFWWHSHVHMASFWSGTDEGTASTFGSDYLVAIVLNKRGEYRLQFRIYQPRAMQWDNLVLHVVHAPRQEIHERARRDIQRLVRPDGFGRVLGGFRQTIAYDRDAGAAPLSTERRDNVPLVVGREYGTPVSSAVPPASPTTSITEAAAAALAERGSEVVPDGWSGAPSPPSVASTPVAPSVQRVADAVIAGVPPARPARTAQPEFTPEPHLAHARSVPDPAAVTTASTVNEALVSVEFLVEAEVIPIDAIMRIRQQR